MAFQQIQTDGSETGLTVANKINENFNNTVEVVEGQIVRTVASESSANPETFDFPNLIEALYSMMSTNVMTRYELQLDDGEHYVPNISFIKQMCVLLKSISGNKENCSIGFSPNLTYVDYSPLFSLVSSSLELENITLDNSNFSSGVRQFITLRGGSTCKCFGNVNFVIAHNSWYPIQVSVGSEFVSTDSSCEISIVGGTLSALFSVSDHSSVSSGATISDVTTLVGLLSNNGTANIFSSSVLTNVANIYTSELNKYSSTRSIVTRTDGMPLTSSGDSGDTASRPLAVNINTQYFDTTLGKPIWFNGTDWIDATGTVV